MTIIPIAEQEVAAVRALRTEFARFWSTAKGEPEDIYDQFMENGAPIADGVTMREADDLGPGWWVEPAAADPDRAILFLHGGGYSVGHAKAYRGFVSQIATRARAPAFALEYPLSTKAPLPVAIELAVQTLTRLAATFKSVAVVGDSAGGGLTFATVLEARRRGVKVAAIATFSPWVDLTLTSPSFRELAITDPLLDPAYLRACATQYLGPVPADDPRASPLFATDLGLLPPTLIQVGADEILLDDSRSMAAKAAAAGVEVDISVWQGMHHVFPVNVALPAARRALDAAAAFLGRHWTS